MFLFFNIMALLWQKKTARTLELFVPGGQ